MRRAQRLTTSVRHNTVVLLCASFLLSVPLFFPSKAMRLSAKASIPTTRKLAGSEIFAQRPDSSFRVYLPHWTTEDGFASVLYIRNVQMVNAVRIRMSLSLKHRTVILAEKEIDAAQTISVDVGQELIANGERAEQEGSSVIDYTANSAGGINAWAQVVNEARSLSFSFSFMQNGSTHEGPLDGVAWYYDRDTDAFLSLQNTTNDFVRVRPILFIEGQDRSVGAKRLKPHETVSLKLPPPPNDTPYPFSEGVRIEYDAAPGAIVTQGWTLNRQRGFSAAFTFHHNGTCPCAPGEQRHLYGAGVAIGTGNMMAPGATFHPQLVMRNNSSAAMTVTPVFKYHSNGAPVSVTLPAVNLGAQRTVVTDLRQYQLDGTIPLTVNDGDIELNYQSDSGVLIGELASVDENGTFVSPVPLICSGNRALHMAFWRTDGDWDSMLTIENISNQSNEVEITISYPGGLYVVEKTLAAGETGMLSVKELQQSQTPDRDGNTIPFTATVGGMNIWSKNVNNGLVINGMIVNPVARTCGYCGGFGVANEWGLSDIPRSCGGSFEDRDVGDVVPLHMWISFSTNQCGDDEVQDVHISTPLILQAGLDSTTVETIGVGTGELDANSQGTWPTDEQSCDYGVGGHLNASSQIGVKPKIDSLSPSRGLIGTTVQVNIIGGFASTGTPTVQVAGSGVSATVGSTSSSTIQTTFTVAANATAGNHAVTVTISGRTSNSMNFFVQVPTRLERFNYPPGAPNGYGPLTLTANTNNEDRDVNGTVILTNQCGVYRNLVYELKDQEGQSIIQAFDLTETFSNYSGQSGTPGDITAHSSEGLIQDNQYLGRTLPNCLGSNDHESFDQRFVVTIGSSQFTLTTIVHISRGRFSGTWAVDVTTTTS